MPVRRSKHGKYCSAMVCGNHISVGSVECGAWEARLLLQA